MIDDRKFLTWTLSYIVAISAIGIAVSEFLFPEFRDHPFIEIVMFLLALSAALLAIGVTIDAIREIFVQRHYAWLWLIVLLAFAGAYLYGFLVATREQSDEFAA